MKLNFSIWTVIVVSCILLLYTGCQEQSYLATESQTSLELTKPAIVSEDIEPTPQADTSMPEIVFEKEFHNFGNIGPETTHLYEFEFANAGDGILRIKEIQSTCDCVVPELDKREYTPGDGGVIKVEYHSGRRLGPVTRVLYVPSNDKSRPEVKLAIVANITAVIDYEPKILRLSLKDENAGCKPLTIRCSDDRPFSISGFESTGNCMTLDFDPSVKKTEFVLEPKVDTVRLGNNLKGQITISLTHPDYNSVEIPYSALSRFKLSPPAIMIFGGKPKNPIIRQIWLHNNYDEVFQVESISSAGNMTKILQHKWVGSRYWIALQIKTPTIESGQKEFEETVYINLKDGTKLELLCKWRFPDDYQSPSSSS